MFWSDPRTSWPRLLSSAATVAIAVPQTPIRWMRLLNGRLLDDDRRMRSRRHAHVHAERKRPAWSRRMTGRKTEQHRAPKLTRQPLDDVTYADRATGLVAAAHFAKDQRNSLGQRPALRQLRQHSVDAVRPLVHVLQKQ